MAQKIGEYLVEIGKLTQAQADQVAKVQSESGAPRPFGEVAVSLGLVDEQTIKNFFANKS